MSNDSKPTRKLIRIDPAVDSDGTQISLYTYEVTKNGVVTTQTVKTRRTPKYKDCKYEPDKHKTMVIDELVKYFNSYNYTTSNQLEEFRVLTKDNTKLKQIIDHLQTTLNVHLTQIQLKQIIATDLISKLKVKISF